MVQCLVFVRCLTCGGDEPVAYDVGLVGNQYDGVVSLGRTQLLQTRLGEAIRRPVSDRIDDQEAVN